jgi:hypothetical protein
MKMPRVLQVIFFLSLIAERDVTYMNYLPSPGQLIGWFLEPHPLHASVYELLCAGMLFAAWSKGKGARVRPMRRALAVSLLTVLLWVLFGLLNGGWGKGMYTQIHFWTFAMIFSVAVGNVMTTREDFRGMLKAIVYAALYRATMGLAFYAFVARSMPDRPAVMTNHEDTVLFVMAILILLSEAVELRTRKAIRNLVLAAPFIMAAVQVNNRRIAWASLAAGILVLYLLLPAKGRVTRRINRGLLVLAPVLVTYVIVGWGRPGKLFKPLASLSSMMGGGKVDESTKARDIENFGLVLMVQAHPLVGTGLGHEWLEVDDSHTVPVSVFPMYHYMPHNGVTVMLGFLGGLGFAGLWLPLPVAVYLNRRSYRMASDPQDRVLAAVGVTSVVVVMNQMFGDMGFITNTPLTIMGVGFAAASKLPVWCGAWPEGRARPLPAAPAASAPAA